MAYISDYELANQYFLTSRNCGPSLKLRGKVVIVNILVNDMISNWMDSNCVRMCQQEIEYARQILENNAHRWGAPLSIQQIYYTVNIPTYANMAAGNWPMYIYMQFGQNSAAGMQAYFERMYGCDEAPVVLLLNNEQRSYAQVAEQVTAYMDEFSVVYRTGGSYNRYAYIHELLHQFGARDYYYPDVTVRAAERYFPQSVMFQWNGQEIDDLTSYMVGWCDYLTGTAVDFLAETKNITIADVQNALMREQAKTTGGYGGYGGFLLQCCTSGHIRTRF